MWRDRDSIFGLFGTHAAPRRPPPRGDHNRAWLQWPVRGIGEQPQGTALRNRVLGSPGCSAQFGRASSAPGAHRARPERPTGSALMIVRWWHRQHDTSSDRTLLARMLPSGPGSRHGRFRRKLPSSLTWFGGGNCDGFRMPANSDLSTGTRDGVRKPPKNETAGTRAPGGSARAMGNWLAPLLGHGPEDVGTGSECKRGTPK